MSKVRINDLARELEVKSKSILDALTAVGVTEKKTHSSSIEADEAEKVRAYLSGGSRASGAAASRQPERPKFDLSKVSKPGDALKAILERKQAEAAAKAAPPVVARPAVVQPPPTQATTPQQRTATPAPAASSASVTTATAPAATTPGPRKIVPQPRQAANIVAPPPAAPAIASKPPSGPVVARPAAPPPASAAGTTTPQAPSAPRPSAAAATSPVVATPAKPAAPLAPAVTPAPPQTAEAPREATPAAPPSVPNAAAPVAPAAAPEAPATPQTQAPAAGTPAPQAPAPTTPAAPARRVIMPQTGPRPIYTAPTPAPGAPPRNRPIFERPRPQGPGGRPPLPPGARRPMHPTRSFPGGSGPGGPGGRPGFGGPGGSRPGFGGPRPGFGGPRPGAPGLLPPGAVDAPAGRPAGRPAQRRGGNQRYEKSKEGPMKGFAPPPRFGGAQIPQQPLPITRTITVTEGISVKDLAEKLDIRGKDLIATLLMRGVFVTVNQSLDGELVKDVARQFGADATIITVEEQLENEAIEGFLEDTTGMTETVRSPVVTVMGHVDHGKTSLLDAIRQTDVAAGEAGGITQHIGAYKVHVNKPDSPAFGREIVFLDTPGHEAFTRMRARGAKVTDIVVIVVAADDGVMPQTLEAIDHAKAANVPIIVAINKIDKPEANPDRIKQQLAERGLQLQGWGGDVEYVEVSAKKHINLDKLEEMICLVADINEQKAQPDRPAVGTVIEAKLDRGRGVVASILVQNGTLRTGDSYIVGNTFGKVRAMFDDRGRAIADAGPSTPVEILGLEAIPDAGDTFLVMADRDRAKEIARYRTMKEREAQLAKSSRVSLEGLAEQIKQAGMKDLNLILKGDVQGSVEVLADSLEKMSTEKVRVRVLRAGVGAITESDVLLASASNAVVIGFNVRPDRKAAEIAERENVEIRIHSIIYELQDEITKAMYGLLEPVFKENYLGRAEVMNVFKITKVGQIAGCIVRDGLIKRDAQVKLERNGEVVWKGKIASLKRFKDDVPEVRQGVECGIDLGSFKDVQVGDFIEAFTTERLAAELGRTAAERKAAAAAETANA
ncbi:translation initiation factor IF-2 [Edaphobacter sp. 12200R-103]|uniref:translation initiation factor IF-2 n=1 Tax=Edaphobacter sp. 12200R-103 TaxID=2703788 RepID=UPI00138DC391|nr:translation initiation factor IF-2 [Edaphobacter sp. 12200R-103]QHS53512.1 translation initiation factor IF-2 [Edaphobacter sp. 12200R-103]